MCNIYQNHIYIYIIIYKKTYIYIYKIRLKKHIIMYQKWWTFGGVHHIYIYIYTHNYIYIYIWHTCLIPSPAGLARSRRWWKRPSSANHRKLPRFAQFFLAVFRASIFVEPPKTVTKCVGLYMFIYRFMMLETLVFYGFFMIFVAEIFVVLWSDPLELNPQWTTSAEGPQ